LNQRQTVVRASFSWATIGPPAPAADLPPLARLLTLASMSVPAAWSTEVEQGQELPVPDGLASGRAEPYGRDPFSLEGAVRDFERRDGHRPVRGGPLATSLHRHSSNPHRPGAPNGFASEKGGLPPSGPAGGHCLPRRHGPVRPNPTAARRLGGRPGSEFDNRPAGIRANPILPARGERKRLIP
jgi:hypothetical protein